MTMDVLHIHTYIYVYRYIMQLCHTYIVHVRIRTYCTMQHRLHLFNQVAISYVIAVQYYEELFNEVHSN